MAILTVTSISGPKKSQNLKISPALQQKMAQKTRRTPTLGVGAFHVSMFCLLSHLCPFLALVFIFPSASCLGKA